VWHLFVVRSKRREALQQHLKAQGIQTLIHYPVPPHMQQAYVEMGAQAGTYPISEAIHREVLSLPMGPHLSEDNAHRVVEAVRAFYA
jgi:dTDP-4-amino-4,6-dideoxygalactose transaminase